MRGAGGWRPTSFSQCISMRGCVGRSRGLNTRKAQKFVRVNYEISSAHRPRKAARFVSAAREWGEKKAAQGSFCLSFVVGCCWVLRAVFYISPSKLQVYVGEGVKETCSPRARTRIFTCAPVNRNKKLFTLGNHNKSPTMSCRVLSLWQVVCVKVNRGSCAVEKHPKPVGINSHVCVKVGNGPEAINLGAHFRWKGVIYGIRWCGNPILLHKFASFTDCSRRQHPLLPSDATFSDFATLFMDLLQLLSDLFSPGCVLWLHSRPDLLP